MVRKLVCAMVVMTLTVGFVLGDELTGLVSNVEGNKFKFQPTKKGKAEGDAKDLTLAKDGKVVKGVFNKDTKKFEPGDAIEGGLTNKIFTGKKGVAARVTFEGSTASQILVVAKKKKAAQ